MNTFQNSMIHTVDLSDFLVRGKEILGKLKTSGVILINDGKPIARITPLLTVNNESLIGSMKDRISIKGDIYSTGLKWDAEY